MWIDVWWQALEKAGFAEVDARDNTKQFITVLSKEKSQTEKDKENLLKVKVFKFWVR